MEATLVVGCCGSLILLLLLLRVAMVVRATLEGTAAAPVTEAMCDTEGGGGGIGGNGTLGDDRAEAPDSELPDPAACGGGGGVGTVNNSCDETNEGCC